jgi:DNA-binding response OmpR family regulator
LSRKVLVVEDEPAIRDLLQLALEQEGYPVALATDGYEALTQLERERPELILLDLMLPHMDGVTFVAELERSGRRAGVPILVLSAASHASSTAAEIRAEGYLPKPFDLVELLDQVRALTRPPVALAS